jgi:hypothetical protein
MHHIALKYSGRTEANTNEGKYDQLRDYQESKVSRNNCAI